MNLRTAAIAYRVANTLYGRYRNLNNEQKRDVYEAVRHMALNDASVPEQDSKNRKEVKQGAARRQAGELTRAAHNRLDRQRALFDLEQEEKKAKKQAKKQEKKGKRGIGLGAGILALLAAVAGGVYYFLQNKDNKPAQTVRKDHKPVVKTGEKKNSDGSVTHVYSAETDHDAAQPTHGPLSEEPAERDEELLSSIDEQLSTLDTLDDEQRNATEPRGN